MAIRQETFGSAILHALNEALDERMIETAVARALARIRTDQQHIPDRRTSLNRELSLIEIRLRHLVELIAEGRRTDSIIAALNREEARKQSIVKDLAGLDELAEVVSLDEKRLAKQLQDRLKDLPTLFERHIPLARKLLQTLLDGHILCDPIEQNGKPGYRFTATGTFDRLLTGRTLVNHSGGGEGS